MNLMYFWTIAELSPSFGTLQVVSTPLLPQGTTVYATAALSMIDTLFFGKNPDPTFSAEAFILEWTVYQDDGTQSDPISPTDFFTPAAVIQNCATVTFGVFGERAYSWATLNVFSL